MVARLVHLIILGATAATLSVIGGAHATEIHTGGASGAYHSNFCPLLQKRIAAVGGDYTCRESLGSSDNLRAVSQNPSHIGFSQLDVFALESERYGGARTFTQIRSDDARECVFAVTRNKNLTNYGEIAVYADRLKFILPPRASGSASTFEYLSSIDPTGLAQARDISYAETTDDAIRRALESDEAVTFFVQFPDPSNERFKMIRRLGGHLVPVVDGVILDQKIDGQQIYFAQETQISQIPWLRAGRTVITACTPLVLFTGDSRRIPGSDARLAHRQLIENIRALPSKDLLPQGSVFVRLVKQTREASRNARDYFLRVSASARLRARPFFERMWHRATETVQVMINKAQPRE